MKPIKNKPGTIPPIGYKLNTKSNNWVYCLDPKIINPKTGRCIKQIENIVKKAIKQDAVAQKKVNSNAGNDLKYTIKNRNLKALKDLINSGSLNDLDIKKILKQVNKDNLLDFGNSILDFAVSKNDIEVVKFYVKNGIDMNKNTEYYGSPLVIAIINGYLDIVKFLVEHGAKLDNALSYAAEYGQLDIAKYLIKRGAILDSKLLNDLPKYGIFASTEGKMKIAEVVRFLRNVAGVEK